MINRKKLDYWLNFQIDYLNKCAKESCNSTTVMLYQTMIDAFEKLESVLDEFEEPIIQENLRMQDHGLISNEVINKFSELIGGIVESHLKTKNLGEK